MWWAAAALKPVQAIQDRWRTGNRA